MRSVLPPRALLALALTASACSVRPEGAPIVSLAGCAELGGQAVLAPGDGGVLEACGETSLVLGRLDPDEVGPAGGLCCS